MHEGTQEIRSPAGADWNCDALQLGGKVIFAITHEHVKLFAFTMIIGQVHRVCVVIDVDHCFVDESLTNAYTRVILLSAEA